MNPPSIVRAVTVAVPAKRPMTLPLGSTDTTAGSDDVHPTSLSVAEAGATVALSRAVCPDISETAVGLTVTPVADTGVTDKDAVAVNPPSRVRAVMTAVPGAKPSTTPELDTDAMSTLDEAQMTAWSAAFAGRTDATSEVDVPAGIEANEGVTEMPVTGTGTVIEAVAENPPSTVVTVTTAVPAATPVMTPPAVTDTTAGSLEDHLTERFVAALGETVAVSVAD